MIAFVGLGNPGNEYARTKHNAGFWIVDELARSWNQVFQPGQGEYVYTDVSEPSVLLMKPTTGMNISGTAVKQAANCFDINFRDLYIIIDDVDLPLGKLRIKTKGGDGCHRGMESVIYHLGTTQFPRLRLGIAAEDQKRPSESYILKPFRKKDQSLAEDMVQTAADAVESLLEVGLDRTMNRYNS